MKAKKIRELIKIVEESNIQELDIILTKLSSTSGSNTIYGVIQITTIVDADSTSGDWYKFDLKK